MLPKSVAVLPCHLGWRTLLKCNKTNHACLPACLMCRSVVHKALPGSRSLRLREECRLELKRDAVANEPLDQLVGRDAPDFLWANF